MHALARPLIRRASYSANLKPTSPEGAGRLHLASMALLDVIHVTGAAAPYRVTPLHLLDAVAGRMEAYKASHALVQETLTQARDQAAAGEATRLSAVSRSALDGIPLALTGNWALAGTPLETQRTRLLPGYAPTASATLVERLQQAGSPFSGKSYVNEFGIGAVEMTVQADAVLSPWYSTDERSKEARFVGGRSGGPAAAVATGMAFAALGSDLGGSLRLPAAYAGTIGLMASKDSLPRQGLLSIAPSLDMPGVVAKTVADAAILLATLQDKDSGCKRLQRVLRLAADKPQDVDNALPALLGFPEGDRPLEGMRIGVVEFGEQGIVISDAQKEALEHGMEYLARSGASVEKQQLPDLHEAVGAFYLKATGEVLQSKGSLDKLLSGLGFKEANTSAEVVDEVASILEATRARGLQAAGHSEMSWDAATRTAGSFSDALMQLFKGEVDMLLLPSAPGAAPTVADASQWGDKQLLAVDALNVPASLAGAPAITVPVALTSAEGLPVGLQLIAAPMAETRLLAAAHVIAHQSQRHSDAAGGKSLLMPLRSPDEGKAPIDTV